MKAMLCVAALVAAGGCGSKKNKNPTPVGTAVVTWDHTQSDRASMKTAKIGAHKLVNQVVAMKMVDGSTVKLEITAGVAPVTLHEDGVDKAYHAPVKVTAKVIDGADFTFDRPKCAGPHYQMGSPTPPEMLLDCTLHATKPDAELMLAFDVFGDGRMVDAFEGAKKTEIPH